MGIIKRQAIHSTIYIYIGVFLGFFNAAVLLPKLISPDQIGLISLLGSYTNLFSSIFALGIPFLIVKVFPQFRSEGDDNHNGFISFLILMTGIGVVLGSFSFLAFNAFFIPEGDIASDYYIFFISFYLIFSLRLVQKNSDTFIRMLHNTWLGSLTESFILKAFIAIILVIYWLVDGYNFELFFSLYMVALAIPGLTSLWYLIKNKLVNFQWKSFRSIAGPQFTHFRSIGLFGLLGSLGTIIVLEVDKIMIGNMLGLSETGIYTTCFFFGLFISVASRGLKRISTVVISEAWQRNDLDLIKSVYYKSCLNQTIIGLYLFLGVSLNIESILLFLPKEYSIGENVILFIGLANLADMATGVNIEIIFSSKFYKFNTYFIVVLIFLVVLLNYLLIPVFGVSGAALATAIAMILVNLGRCILLYIKIKYQPYDWRVLVVFVLGIVCYISINSLVPTVDNLYLNILIKGTFLTVVYWLVVYFLKLSKDINDLVYGVIQKLIK